tara:strand:- start:592 stop:1452 length:861 start_codon:yes stop_codon:yes gene_type:complete
MSSFWEEVADKRVEIVFALLFGIGGFFAGQSLQQFENKTLVQAKDSIDTKLKEFEAKVNSNLKSINSDVKAEIEKNNKFQQSLVEQQINNANRNAEAAVVLKQGEKLVEHAELILKSVKSSAEEFKNIIDNKGGISNAEIAKLVQTDLLSKIKELEERLKSTANSQYLDNAVLVVRKKHLDTPTGCPIGWESWSEADGLFLRGVDNSGVVDPDGLRELGSIQLDSVIAHTHPIQKRTKANLTGQDWRNAGYLMNDDNLNEQSETLTNGDSTETRPKNIAVLFCVKA